MLKRSKEFYQALLNKDKEYEGIFFAAIKTTGIFCRPSCTARKPKFENCEFFENAQDALLAGYRACKRCDPLNDPDSISPAISKLISAVEQNPTKKWKDQDFRDLNIDESTARRQFKKRFGMTFIAYARARRLGIAFKTIREGDKVINAQIDAGYESESGFRDAFFKTMGTNPSQKTNLVLNAEWIDTPLGPMMAMCTEDSLYLLEFIQRRGLEKEIEKLRTKHKAAIIPGRTKITEQIEQELKLYFEGKLKAFKTPFTMLGSPFQKSVWEELCRIPYGETISYKDEATSLGKPTAFRAVANANGCNQLAIIIPCHRVINTGGALGGYGGGIQRKEWLLAHEKKNR